MSLDPTTYELLSRSLTERGDAIRQPDCMPECGYIREQWDGPYRMRDRCTAKASHTDSRMAFDHGPWQMLE